jgi:hypothetical protein
MRFELTEYFAQSGDAQSGIPGDVLLSITDGGLFEVTAAGLFGVTPVRDSSEGRALGECCNGAGRWWVPV